MANINVLLGNLLKKGGILKFVDVGEGSGKLGGGVLAVEKAAEFIQAMKDETVILDAARYLSMKSDKRDIDLVSMRIEMHSARRDPVTGKIPLTSQDPKFKLNQLVAEKLMAMTSMTYEALEDNIQQGVLESVITSLFGGSIGAAEERIFVWGKKDADPTKVPSTGYTEVDGWLEKANPDNILYGGGSSTARDFDPATGAINDDDGMFAAMYDAMPSKYRKKAVFFVPDKRNTEFRRTLKGKDTQLGDDANTGEKPLTFEGRPLVPAPVLDEPLEQPDFFQPETIMFTDPANLVWGAKRDLMIETDKNIYDQMYYWVASMRVDCNHENEDNTIFAQPGTTKPSG